MMDLDNYPINLQQQIEKDIVEGILAGGNINLLSELAAGYQIDPADLKMVLPSLIRKGLLVSVDNSSLKIVGLPPSKVESVFQFAQKSKLKPRTIVREVSVIEADELLACKLETTPGAPIYQQVRTRLVDEHILANQYNFIPFEICPGLEDVDLSHRSFQVTLEEDYHTVITKINEIYMLGNPTRDDREILDLQADDQVLIVERMSYCRSGMPVVYADIHVNPAQFHYVASLWPKAESIILSMVQNGARE